MLSGDSLSTWLCGLACWLSRGTNTAADRALETESVVLLCHRPTTFLACLLLSCLTEEAITKALTMATTITTRLILAPHLPMLSSTNSPTRPLRT